MLGESACGDEREDICQAEVIFQSVVLAKCSQCILVRVDHRSSKGKEAHTYMSIDSKSLIM